MPATLNGPALYSGRFRADGRIVTATPGLRLLHERCGGGATDPVAVPGLPSLIRRAASLKMPLGASVLVADGPRNVTYWARAAPVEDAVELQLFDWDGGSAELTRPLERAMRERDFTRAASDWLWEVDSELRFRVLSDTATAALDQPSPLLIGKPMIEVLQPLARSNGEATELRSGPEAAAWFNDLVVQTRREPPRFFRLNGKPIYDGERLTGLRGTAVEISRPVEPSVEGRTVHAPANADDAASEVSATDMLRGPLEQITRQAEAMRVQSFGHLKSVYTGYAGDIATAARHLRTLIDDVFDVAAIDSGTVALSIEKVDLTTLVEEARAIVSQRAAASGSRVMWRIPPASVIVRADWGRTLQVLINLMQNAIKFAGQVGPIHLSLDTEDQEARLHVDDQGRGIAAADRERIFLKFERLQPATTEGSGLGLYISRALARAMGGDIALSASPEGGARFTLILPRA